ncbi:MAG: AAA family ATPase [Phycisphaerae bacterium]
MIESLHILGLKAARSVVLDDLGAINLFIGPNGSGKTTLLQAAFLFSVESDVTKLIALSPTETNDPDARAVDDALSWLFSDAESSAEVSISGRLGGRERKVSVKRAMPTIAQRTIGNFDRPLAIGGAQGVSPDIRLLELSNTILELQSKEQGDELLTSRLFVSHAFGVFPERPPRQPRLLATYLYGHGNAEALAGDLDNAQSSGRIARIEDLLRGFDADVSQLRIGVATSAKSGTSGKPVVRVDHKRLGVCPLTVLGEGFTAALAFALSVSDPDSSMAMIDEFDRSLHVSAIRELAEFARSIAVGEASGVSAAGVTSDPSPVQLFLTTHRADTLGAFVELVENGWDGLRVYQTRLESGEIRVQKFSGERLLSVWRDLALDIRVPA